MSIIVPNSFYAINQVGVQANSDGAQTVPRAGRLGELIVNDVGLGRYYEAARRGKIFHASNAAGQALSVNSTTATGLIITNPPSSGKNIVLLRLVVGITVVAAGITALILTGDPGPNAAVTHTTPLTPKCSLFGDTTVPVAKVDSAATLAVATLQYFLNAAAASPASGVGNVDHEFAGDIIMIPGTALSLQALTTAETVVASLSWAEVDV